MITNFEVLIILHRAQVSNKSPHQAHPFCLHHDITTLCRVKKLDFSIPTGSESTTCLGNSVQLLMIALKMQHIANTASAHSHSEPAITVMAVQSWRNNELGKASPLLPKLICREMCLVGNGRTVPSASQQLWQQVPAGRLGRAQLPQPSATTTSCFYIQTHFIEQFDLFFSELEGRSFFVTGFSFEADQMFFCLFLVVVSKK